MLNFHAVELQRIKERLRELRRQDPESQVLYLWRFGVCFGKERVFTFHLRQAIDFIEERVVTPLAPFFAHSSS